MSLFLIRGTEGSSIFNGFIVFLKVSVILIFVILGWKYINTDNYTPYIPANTGVLGEYGFSGILRGAAIVFFAFLGFDAVSTAAQETKNPKRNMPIGILVSLLVCTVLYMVFAHVMTGVAHYTAFSGQQGIAPVAIYEKTAKWTLFDLQAKLQQSGWMVPAYTMPANIEQLIVMRIVVRQGMSRDMADMLMGDIRNAVEEFEKLQYPTQSRLLFEKNEKQKGKVYTH